MWLNLFLVATLHIRKKLSRPKTQSVLACLVLIVFFVVLLFFIFPKICSRNYFLHTFSKSMAFVGCGGEPVRKIIQWIVFQGEREKTCKVFGLADSARNPHVFLSSYLSFDSKRKIVVFFCLHFSFDIKRKAMNFICE